MNKIYKSIGLMSGTSMDGIDLALIESNGQKIIKSTHFDYLAYDENFKNRLRELIYKKPNLSQIKLVENELTLLHANLVNDFLAKNKIDKSEIDLVAFHGHTILHIPEQKITWQLGNGHLLASEIGINVVTDFRTKDVVLGGQGAPLVPIYHFYLLAKQKHPLAVLNIGGISNITYIGDNDENNIEAFDICFGNAPLDDLVKKQTGRDFDEDGKLTATGKVDFALAEKILANPIFNKKPPKSFDRDDFATILHSVNELKIENALATLAFMHARAIQMNLDFFNQKPEKIFVCGGGRKNMALMREMKKLMPEISIQPIEEIGLNGDAIEAEAFAFLGIRSFLKLPISFQNTTGLKLLNSAHGGVSYLNLYFSD